MTDTSPQIASAALEPATFDWNAPATRRRFAARHRADRRLQIYGLSAIALAVLLIAVLIGSLVSTGYQSFVPTNVSFEVYADPTKRSEERRVGQECVNTGSSRWWMYH